MASKSTSRRPPSNAAFTLVEVLVASALALVLLAILAILSLFGSRSFAAMANYISMDQSSQNTLDKMSREIRQAHSVIDISSNYVTFNDADNNLVNFTYDPTNKVLLRTSGGVVETNLTGCDSLQFSNYQRTTISNTFDAYLPAYKTNTRLIQVTWTCSRSILGSRLNSEGIQSAKIVIRNNY